MPRPDSAGTSGGSFQNAHPITPRPPSSPGEASPGRHNGSSLEPQAQMPSDPRDPARPTAAAPARLLWVCSLSLPYPPEQHLTTWAQNPEQASPLWGSAPPGAWPRPPQRHLCASSGWHCPSPQWGPPGLSPGSGPGTVAATPWDSSRTWMELMQTQWRGSCQVLAYRGLDTRLEGATGSRGIALG